MRITEFEQLAEARLEQRKQLPRMEGPAEKQHQPVAKVRPNIPEKEREHC